MTAPEIYVRESLLAVLPPRTPPSGRVVSAVWRGSGRRRVAVGTLEMFDGLPATVEVYQAGVCTVHRYTDMPGGDCCFERGAWRRVERPAQ